MLNILFDNYYTFTSILNQRFLRFFVCLSQGQVSITFQFVYVERNNAKLEKISELPSSTEIGKRASQKEIVPKELNFQHQWINRKGKYVSISFCYCN